MLLLATMMAGCFLFCAPGERDAGREAPAAPAAASRAQQASDAAPGPAGKNAPGSTLASVRIESTADIEQSNVPFTFGQVFKQGDLFPADGIAGRLPDGTALPLQIDVKARHADGSIRHAILSGMVPALAGRRTLVLKLVKAMRPPAMPPALTPAAFAGSGFSARISIAVEGQVYSAAAERCLLTGRRIAWLSGEVANEWIVAAPLKTESGIEHPHLIARFAIRAYGRDRARVDLTVESAWAYEPGPRNLAYDAQVSIGGHVVASLAGFTHYHHARWRKTFWWGAPPQVRILPDTAYLIAAKAIPNYDPSLVIPDAVLASLEAGWRGPKTEPMGVGMADPGMANTGGRPDIGLLPGWSVIYLLTLDARAERATLGTADLAGSWPVHYRDKATDRPVSLVDYPYMTLLGHHGDTYNRATKKHEEFPACAGACATPNNPDSAHQPAFSYLPYLVTGDYYHLEELQFWAMWNLLQHNPYYREFAQGLVRPDQVRGQAWSLRTLSEAAYITPDDDALKAQFRAFLKNNLDWYNANYTDNPNANRLGIIVNGHALMYNDARGVAPWMDDFFTSAIGHAAELGFAEAVPLLKWKARFPVARMTDPGFCWIFGASYSLNVRDAADSPLYATFHEVYRNSRPPALTSLACAGDEMARALQLKPGEMVGYSSEALGFPSNMQPALAYSVDAGAEQAAAAWRTFMRRSVKPGDYIRYPEFAIVPR